MGGNSNNNMQNMMNMQNFGQQDQQGGQNGQKKTPNPNNYKIVKCKNFESSKYRDFLKKLNL